MYQNEPEKINIKLEERLNRFYLGIVYAVGNKISPLVNS